MCKFILLAVIFFIGAIIAALPVGALKLFSIPCILPFIIYRFQLLHKEVKNIEKRNHEN